ncbi:MAG: hypothetical protein KKD44_29055, partial [Proteobacteria bacterium]|nr:hypothetical protein [Pseudomonadota bacterium]
KDLGEDELSPMDKLRGLMAAFANAVETAELFRERGTSRPATDTDMEKIDPNDDTIPAGDRVDALITQEIAKAEKAGEKIDFSKARKQVLAANPKLAAAYL